MLVASESGRGACGEGCPGETIAVFMKVDKGERFDPFFCSHCFMHIILIAIYFF